MHQRPSILARTWTTPVILIAILLAVALAAVAVSTGPFNQTVIEIFIRVVLVVGLYVFIGNSGVISFGHIGFTCLGAYMTAWLTMLPAIKKSKLKGLPDIILNAKLQYGWGLLAAAVFAAVCAYVIGKVLMRLSGIAASIASFAVLAVIIQVYSNWDSVTGAQSSVVGIPIIRTIWPYFACAVIVVVVAYFYSISRSGLALRAARDEATAAAASGVDIPRERLIAFVISGAMMGLGGALFAHSVGVVTPDTFYLGLTFITLSMLVVGGMNSLSGAVLGVVVLSTIIQVLRWFEKGIDVGGTVLTIPNGVQEIAIGIVMIVILMFRPTGMTRNRELVWPGKKLSAEAGAMPSSADGKTAKT
ncbi:branched-chain amino acid ABC transporter permease [Aestuariivirga sp.]|uniref:branched-chain amino acid ABC transporter permease n=1 Tax=Aestuariivirga sp. TaxID=2650926 RepID=UPI00359429C7